MTNDKIMHLAGRTRASVNIALKRGDIYTGKVLACSSADDEEEGFSVIVILTPKGEVLGFGENEIETIEIIEP